MKLKHHDVGDTLTKEEFHAADLHEGFQTAIKDDDADTKVDVEESADEDKIRMDVKGVEALLLSDAGILTLAKQSACRVTLSGDQVIPTATYVWVRWNSEIYDVQNEFDSSVVSGTADATVANKLHDTGAFTQPASYYVNRYVWNTTDNTYAKVTAKDSNDQLSIDADIMAIYETYELYFGRFTAKEAGKYLVVVIYEYWTISDQKQIIILLYKNGSNIGVSRLYTSYGVDASVNIAYIAIVDLAANDYLETRTWHNQGANRSLKELEYRSSWTILKMA